MIGNYLCTILFIAAAWLTGFAFLRLTGFCALHRAVRWIALPAGIAVFALSAAILYFGLEQNVGVIRIVCGIFAVVSLIYLVRKKTGVKQVVCLAAILILFTVMALPGMLRGTKWYVHRRNIWDKEFYLSEVVYMCRYDINYGMEGIMQEEYPSDVLVKGYSAVQSDRPVVPLLCALLASEGFGDLFFLAYLFIIMVWAAIFCAMMCVMELVMEGLKKGEDTGSGKLIFVQIFFAAIYTLGFYGQLQYDIDAWSQIASAGSLLGFSCMYFLIFREMLSGEGPVTAARCLSLIIMGAGVFLMYPESTMIFGVIFVLVSIVVCIHNRYRISIREFASFALIPAGATGLALAAHPNTVKFALCQTVTAGSAKRQSWADYFDAYWLGIHEFTETDPVKAAVEKLLSLIPSWCGMYMITPDYEYPGFVVMIWLLAEALLCAALTGVFLYSLAVLWKKLSRKDQMITGCFLLSAIFGAGIFLIMVLSGKYWSAGKLLLYLSPLLFLILTEPVLELMLPGRKDKPPVTRPAGREGKKSARIRPVYGMMVSASVMFILCQILSVGMRATDVALNENGTGYLVNYPSDQKPALKEKFPYQFDAKKYRETEPAAIKIKNAWYQDYVKLALAYEGIPYYAVPDSEFDTGRMKEVQEREKPRDGDVVIKKGDTSKN